MSDLMIPKATSSPSVAPNPVRGEERQVVALRLGDETYGIDIAAVNTVIVPQAITVVPKTPRAIKGVMNLRGKILPVIDLRTRFGLPPLSAEEAKRGRIVIVDAEGVSAGLVVDGVSEVLTLDASLIQPPSEILASGDADCITGVGRIPKRDGESAAEDGLILLLDVTKAITFDSPALTSGPQSFDLTEVASAA